MMTKLPFAVGPRARNNNKSGTFIQKKKKKTNNKTKQYKNN